MIVIKFMLFNSIRPPTSMLDVWNYSRTGGISLSLAVIIPPAEKWHKHSMPFDYINQSDPSKAHSNKLFFLSLSIWFQWQYLHKCLCSTVVLNHRSRGIFTQGPIDWYNHLLFSRYPVCSAIELWIGPPTAPSESHTQPSTHFPFVVNIPTNILSAIVL